MNHSSRAVTKGFQERPHGGGDTEDRHADAFADWPGLLGIFRIALVVDGLPLGDAFVQGRQAKLQFFENASTMEPMALMFISSSLSESMLSSTCRILHGRAANKPVGAVGAHCARRG